MAGRKAKEPDLAAVGGDAGLFAGQPGARDGHLGAAGHEEPPAPFQRGIGNVRFPVLYAQPGTRGGKLYAAHGQDGVGEVQRPVIAEALIGQRQVGQDDAAAGDDQGLRLPAGQRDLVRRIPAAGDGDGLGDLDAPGVGPGAQEDGVAVLRGLHGRAERGKIRVPPLHRRDRPADRLFRGGRPGPLFNGFGPLIRRSLPRLAPAHQVMQRKNPGNDEQQGEELHPDIPVGGGPEIGLHRLTFTRPVCSSSSSRTRVTPSRRAASMDGAVSSCIRWASWRTP